MIKTLKSIGFWLLSLTWGILMTLIGLVIALILLCMGAKHEFVNPYIHLSYGKDWGGISLGPVIITSENPSIFIRQHEMGHGIQNIMYGPFMPFIVGIPSLIRYNFRNKSSIEDKYDFCSIIIAALLVIGILFLVPGICTNILGLTIVGALILAYDICLSCWLYIKELPQYKEEEASIDYYSIWFEKQASELGEKLFPMEYFIQE